MRDTWGSCVLFWLNVVFVFLKCFYFWKGNAQSRERDYRERITNHMLRQFVCFISIFQWHMMYCGSSLLLYLCFLLPHKPTTASHCFTLYCHKYVVLMEETWCVWEVKCIFQHLKGSSIKGLKSNTSSG